MEHSPAEALSFTQTSDDDDDDDDDDDAQNILKP